MSVIFYKVVIFYNMGVIIYRIIFYVIGGIICRIICYIMGVIICRIILYIMGVVIYLIYLVNVVFFLIGNSIFYLMKVKMMKIRKEFRILFLI